MGFFRRAILPRLHILLRKVARPVRIRRAMLVGCRLSSLCLPTFLNQPLADGAVSSPGAAGDDDALPGCFLRLCRILV